MKRRVSPWWLLSGMVFGCMAVAAEPQTAATQDVTFNGIKVAVDSATGRLRPLTPAEERALSGALLKSGKPFPGQPRDEKEAAATKRVHPDGTVQVQVPASVMSEVRAVQDADGTLRLYEGDVAIDHEEASQ
ncbi:hypothetical protein [Lysobacter sp. CFH 32150]|uniref:post-PEP-CTERM-1 domain-containing protein n=1 Tax=Lysobacter sp. CFH 32150 TaxID=2927128 RepID=UPI001FA7EB62|nr:hypothetical protein [Lysobacter sp. CFH 32150]MCI4569171.1 hypothetical protein [Lysobacter sp. CFH 32150]